MSTQIQVAVPFPAQEPLNEMDEALAQLRILRTALFADSQKLEDVNPLGAHLMVSRVIDQLEPIRTFLGENNLVADDMSFLECRRDWFSRNGGLS